MNIIKMAQDTFTHYDLLETIPPFPEEKPTFHDYVSQWWGSLKHIKTGYEKLRKYDGCCDVCAVGVKR